MSVHTESQVVVVAIGRNEGQRLDRCITTASNMVDGVIYVDSGSTDGSVEIALQRGARVVQLDMDKPFTAARARNTGFREVLTAFPDAQLVQFIDGDCELAAGWLDEAADFLQANQHVAIVAGQRKERYPTASIYNELIDAEWRKPAGPAMFCGGDFMVRVDAFDSVGGFRESLIAGEEPELCVRIRGSGWGVHVLDSNMTFHDADMHSFSQWWRRMVRSGHAFAEGYRLHGSSPERLWKREVLRPWMWLFLPIGATALGYGIIGPPALLVLMIYPLQLCRTAMRTDGTLRTRFLVGFFTTISRLPEMVGQSQFLATRLLRRQSVLIEYK